APLTVQVDLVPDLDGLHTADARPAAVTLHEGRDEVGVVLIVVGRAVLSAVLARPRGLEVEPRDDPHPGFGARAHHPIRFVPIEAALAGALDLAPLEERLLPAEPGVGHELQVAVG